MNDDAIRTAGKSLGLSELELGIYCTLLRRGALTGYALAKELGRAGANVYQALTTLKAKGAVMSADAKSKAYRAVPPVEFVASVDRRRQEALSSARAALEAIKPAAPDDAVYSLTSVEQAYERAEALIGRATEVLLFDLFPGPFGRLLASLEEAQRRGVKVTGLIYEEPEARLSEWVFPTPNHGIAERVWPGQGMILVADAKEHLVSLISRNESELLNGVWSDSTYLSCVQHSGLGCEIRLNILLRQHTDLMPGVSLFGSNAPGLRELAPFKEGEDDTGAADLVPAERSNGSAEET